MLKMAGLCDGTGKMMVGSVDGYLELHKISKIRAGAVVMLCGVQISVVAIADGVEAVGLSLSMLR